MAGSEDGWRLISSETKCDSPYLRVEDEFVATPSRPEGVHWMVAYRKVAAVVAPRTPEGNFILVRQERVAVRRTVWEFPAGQIDGTPDEASILETAHRELGEETGMIAKGEIIPMGYYFPSVGFTTECAHLFLATDVAPRPEGAAHDEHEAIVEARVFPAAELRRMIADGEIIDANTLAAYARMMARGLIA